MWWGLLACVSDPPVAEAPDVDCSALPAPPLTGRRVEVPATEDLDFDAHGQVVGSDHSRLIWSTRSGEVVAVVPGIQAPAGLRFVGDDLLVADVTEGALVRLSPDGARTVLHGSLNWPNGIAVAPDGRALVTELSGARVWWVDPDSGEAGVLAEVERPNGIALDVGGRDALVGTMTGEGTLWRVPLDGGVPTVVADGLGAGDLDGVGVDVCGNAYVADIEGGRVLRVRTDGQVEVLLERSEPTGGWPGLRWGSGLGGWEADSLYLPEPDTLTVYELDLGVPSAEAATSRR